ncbi:Sphingomyelin synthase-like domain-containing protein [Entamoeba marina]
MTRIQLEFPNCQYEAVGWRCIPNTYNDIIDSIKHPRKLKKQIPLVVGFFWMAFCGYWNSIFQVLAQERYTKWMLLNPDVPQDLILPDFFLKSFLSLKQLILFTIMPNPTTTVSSIKYHPFLEGFLIMFGIHKTVYDCMFSGHTANIVLCTLFWVHYSHVVPIVRCDCLKSPVGTTNGYPLRLTFTKILAILASVFGMILFCATHLHYSVDIYIALIVAVCLFKQYHNYILSLDTRPNIINSVLRWFEQDAEDIPSCGIELYDVSN